MSARSLCRVLIVESDAGYCDLLQRIAAPHAEVAAAGDFQAAYSRVFSARPDLVITNLRLRGSFDGLHLAYVVSKTASLTRIIVYADRAEPQVTRELQRMGAFYEAQPRLQFALPAYLQAQLPLLDRREPMWADRRATYRGGRRASDVPLISGWGGGL